MQKEIHLHLATWLGVWSIFAISSFIIAILVLHHIDNITLQCYAEQLFTISWYIYFTFHDTTIFNCYPSFSVFICCLSFSSYLISTYPSYVLFPVTWHKLAAVAQTSSCATLIVVTCVMISLAHIDSIIIAPLCKLIHI